MNINHEYLRASTNVDLTRENKSFLIELRMAGIVLLVLLFFSNEALKRGRELTQARPQSFAKPSYICSKQIYFCHFQKKKRFIQNVCCRNDASQKVAFDCYSRKPSGSSEKSFDETSERFVAKRRS
jgi:cbb3-type cytochrome oxidase cytochrome c subunit